MKSLFAFLYIILIDFFKLLAIILVFGVSTQTYVYFQERKIAKLEEIKKIKKAQKDVGRQEDIAISLEEGRVANNELSKK